MAKAAGSTTMYIVGLIFSILVSIGLTVVSWALNEDLTAKLATLERLKAEDEAETAHIFQLNQEVKTLRKLVTGNEGATVTYEHFKTTILDQVNKNLDEILPAEFKVSDDWRNIQDPAIKDTWEFLATKFKREEPRHYTNLSDLYHDLHDQVQAAMHLVPRLRYERLRAKEESDLIRQEKAHDEDQLKREIEAVRTEHHRIQDEKITIERTFDDVKRKLLDDKEKIQGELARVLRDKKLEVARLERDVAERETKIADLTKRDKRTFAETSKPDGEIVHADAGLGYAWIDLGRFHDLPKDLRFQVYQYVKGGKQKIKGMVEVRRLEDDMSQCAILEDVQLRHPLSGELLLLPHPRDPIVKGDLIRTPLYDPHEVRHFVFLGKAKEAKELASRLEQQLVVKDQDGKDKPLVKVQKQVTQETDFVIVMGDLTLEDPTVQDQQRLASEFGIVFMTDRELLEYLGR